MQTIPGSFHTSKLPESRVFCGWKDAYHINLMTTEEIWTAMGEFLYCHGFPRDELDRVISHHPGYKYRNKEVVDFYTAFQEKTGQDY